MSNMPFAMFAILRNSNDIRLGLYAGAAEPLADGFEGTLIR